LARIAKANNFNGLEKVRSNFELVSEEMAVGTLMTNTMKLKRKVARETYQLEIEKIY